MTNVLLKQMLSKPKSPTEALYIIVHQAMQRFAGMLPIEQWLPLVVEQLLLPLVHLDYPKPVAAALTRLCETVDWDLRAAKYTDTMRPRLMQEWLTLYERVVVAQVAPGFIALMTPIATGSTLKSPRETKIQLLLSAMLARKKVKFVYKGLPRIGDVYILGYSRSNTLAVSMYQTAGKSSSYNMLIFKYFLVNGMQNLEILDKPFTPEEDRFVEYDPDDDFFEDVIEQI